MSRPRNRVKPIIRPGRELKLSGDSILIVCEGEKTEPEYFKDLKKQWKINPIQIHITGKCGSAPISVVERAEEILQETEMKFDQIWCVFDRDNHKSFDQAIDKAKTINENIRKNNEDNDVDNIQTFNIAFSIPCFEIWFLLHFKYSAKPFNKGAEIIKEIKKQDKKYTKSKPNHELLFKKLEDAIKNTDKLRRSNIKSGRENPYTDIDLLVKEIQNIKHTS